MIVTRTAWLLLLAGCPLTACSLAPKTQLPEPVVSSPMAVAAELPVEFSNSGETGAYESLQWWRTFADPVLDSVVESALDANYDMAVAVARVQQAREVARISRAAFFPTARARASVDDFNSPTNAGIGAQLKELGLDEALGVAGDDFTLPERLGLTTFSLGVDFAYEVDFWGRAGKSQLADGAAYLASESDFQAARIGIVAETITAYLEIVALRRQMALRRELVELLREWESVAEARYRRGLAGSLAAYQVRQERLSTEALLPEIEHQLTGAEGRLAVMVGGYRRNLDELLTDSLSPAPAAAPVPAGIPADLLQQRPDVRAAGHRLEAAGYDIEVRRAEMLPSLTLAGTIGLQNSQVAGLFNVHQWFSNLAANLLLPVFDGDRLQSNVTLAEARFNEVAALYGHTVVTAVNEVETALAGMRHEDRRHGLLESRRVEAQAEVDLQSERYASGVVDYAGFLDALRTLLDVQSALAGAERDAALTRLALHRALGGGWIASDLPEGPRTIPASTPTERRSE